MPYKDTIRITNNDILTIFRKHFPEETIASISPLPDSFVNPIFKITLGDSSSYILKINNPHWPNKQKREIYAMQLAAKKTSIPIPRVLASYDATDHFPFSYHIQECVLGFDLRKAVREYNLAKKDFIMIIKQVSQCLGELHNISFDFYGDFSTLTRGYKNSKGNIRDQYLWNNQFTTWPECFRAYCLDILYWVDRSSFSAYRPQLRAKIEEFMEKVSRPPHPSFIHSDIQPSNVIIKGKKIAGIVDFEWSYAGSAYFDYLLTSSGFTVSLFPTFKTYSMLSSIPNIYPQEITTAFLASYLKTSNLSPTPETKELVDFISLLYLVGSWNWCKQSSSKSEIVLLEQRVRELLAFFLQ